jgi:hypothetical protein
MATDADMFAGNPMAPAAFGMMQLWVQSTSDDTIIANMTQLRDLLVLALDGDIPF